MGGTYNPDTGLVDWTFHVPLDEQVSFYRAHPPRCLDGLTCTPIVIDFQFDGHGEPVNAMFEVACRCGSKLFIVTGLVEDENLGSPIALECDGCQAEHVVYDPEHHGYDGQMRDLPLPARGDDGHRDEFMPDEVDLPHHVIVRFEFPSDHLGGDAQWKGREQDLFSWITFVARDAETGELEFLYDDECA